MEKITENYFIEDTILPASDLNMVVDKINEIIDAPNSYDDSEVRQLISSANSSIQQLNATALQEKERLDSIINNIDGTVKNKVDAMLQDAEFLEQIEDIVLAESNFGDEDVDEYLQRVGVFTREGANIVYSWSSIQQDVDSLTTQVNRIIDEGVDMELIQSEVNQYVEDAIAGLDISSMYAKKDAESVIEWMYSALKQQAGADKTFNEIVSAGKNGISSAVSELRTYVEKLKNGDYVATASLEASVDDAIAGLKASAGSNYAKTEIFNKLDKNTEDIAGIVVSLTDNSSSAGISTKIGQWKAGLITQSQVNTTVNNATAGLASQNYVNNSVSNATEGLASQYYVNSSVSNAVSELPSKNYVDNSVSSAVSGLMAANDFTAAAIIAKVNDAGSSALINADHIKIDANHQLDLSAQNIVLKSNKVQFQDASGNPAKFSINSTDGSMVASGGGTVGGFTIGTDALGTTSLGPGMSGYLQITPYGTIKTYNTTSSNALDVYGNTAINAFSSQNINIGADSGGSINIHGTSVNINNTNLSNASTVIGHANGSLSVLAGSTSVNGNVSFSGSTANFYTSDVNFSGTANFSGTFANESAVKTSSFTLPSSPKKGQMFFIKGTSSDVTINIPSGQKIYNQNDGNYTTGSLNVSKLATILVCLNSTSWGRFYCG